MASYKSLLALQALIFLIPLNFYMWADWLLVDFQWALVRYQQSYMGTSIIPFYKDIFYILDGRTTGIYNILAVSFWTTGSFFLLIGVSLTLYAWIYGRPNLVRTASLLIIGGGILYCFSALGRFNGGFSVPVGIPFILFIGWWMYREHRELEDDEDFSDEEETTELE